MQYNQKAVDVAAEVSKAVFGKPQTIRTIWMAMLAGGHVLIEDIPGVGKTTLALAFARALELNESRVQFTPDVLPSDIVGFTVFQKETGRLVYHPGSVMCNLFLGDEINRTSSRTQSALLEVMEEGTVTVDGVTHPVPAPFTVIATENPVGAAGTQMLPQSQLDRFTVCVVMGYPDTEAEMQMLAGRGQRTLLEQVHPVANQADLLAMQKEVAGVFIHELMYRYIVDLAQASRKDPRLALGLSPRASLALAGMARAAAYLAGRDFVAPQDVTAVFADVARHRLVLADQAKAGGETVDVVIDDLLRTVPRPRPDKADRHGRYTVLGAGPGVAVCRCGADAGAAGRRAAGIFLAADPAAGAGSAVLARQGGGRTDRARPACRAGPALCADRAADQPQPAAHPPIADTGAGHR
ncbi:AAA family ATPase [Gemmiger sp.]|uniref:AAA family ATPase n=1 Tax=Gemmiger sp. TaxID=2049027 RepID=UPI003A8ECE5E